MYDFRHNSIIHINIFITWFNCKFKYLKSHSLHILYLFPFGSFININGCARLRGIIHD